MTSIIRPTSISKKEPKIKKKVSFLDDITLKEYHSPQKRPHIKSHSFQKSKSATFTTYPEKNKLANHNQCHESPIFTIINNTILYRKNIPSKESKCSFQRAKSVNIDYCIENSREDLYVSFSKDHKISQFTLSPQKDNKNKDKHSLRYALIHSQQEESPNENMRHSVKTSDMHHSHQIINEKDNSGNMRSSMPVIGKRLHIHNEIDDERDEIKFLKKEIEKAIAEIKQLDKESYKIDKESTALKGDIYVKKLNMNKVNIESGHLKNEIKGKRNHLKIIQRQSESIKNSIVVLIKKRLKTKSQNPTLTNQIDNDDNEDNNNSLNEEDEDNNRLNEEDEDNNSLNEEDEDNDNDNNEEDEDKDDENDDDVNNNTNDDDE